MTRKYDLDERLIHFALDISVLVEHLPASDFTKIISDQLLRAGLSPALNYSEAKGAESIKDFIHKLRISLKELRETFTLLRILNFKSYPGTESIVKSLSDESEELISIFVKSIKTSQLRLK